MRLTRQRLRRIIRKTLSEGYEGRYFHHHGTGNFYSPDEQFREEVHFILDNSPSYNAYWEQVYKLIEALDEDERYMAEKIADEMYERHTNKNYDYRY